MGYRHFLWSPPIWVWEIAHIMGQNGGKIGLRGKNPVILSNIFQPGDIMRFIDVSQIYDNGTAKLTKATTGGAVSQTWNIRNLRPL